MIKKLFILSYLFIGVFVLFQASKLIGTTLERKLLSYKLDTNIKKVKHREVLFSTAFGYDNSILLSPLFSVYETAPAGPEAEDIPVTLSPLLKKYELNGVILLSGDRSIALIRRAGQQASEIYHRGDRLENVQIVKIEKDRVFLNDGRNTVILPMYYKYRDKTAQRSEKIVRSSGSADKFSASKQVKKVLSRSDVESRVFQKVNEILTQIAISPYMPDGKMEGLRLARVPKNNIIYELGGRSGDIVRRVNGHEINQIEQMYKLWENIKDDSFVSVDLERNNQMYTFGFEIRE
ncbi:hypothetical protein ES705_46145 [subsurface metagenome]